MEINTKIPGMRTTFFMSLVSREKQGEIKLWMKSQFWIYLNSSTNIEASIEDTSKAFKILFQWQILRKNSIKPFELF